MKLAQPILIGLLLLMIRAARAEEAIDYKSSVKPILQARCYACHAALKQESGLRLDTVAMALEGAVIKPGDAAASPMIERITASDESQRMPPEGERLKPAEIALIKAWIAQGAKGPADEQPERDPRDHWAFKTPVRPAVPLVDGADWVRNPIDAFIAAEQQKRGLRHQPAADKPVWLRRVSLDLVGLPPTAEQIEAFVADQSEQAFDKVVARLLDSPLYGERWGRHWMDIWRYSDPWGLGNELRNSQKHIWHWRDWIIESLNADRGYDQMLREMLAADELYPNDPDRLRGTGFLARHYFRFNRASWMDETVEHTSKAMLGLTFNCAKCHDHKYDPISQAAYYRLRAVFEAYQVRTDMVPGQTNVEKDGIPRAFDCNLDAPTFLQIRGDERNLDKKRPIEPGLPVFLSIGVPKFEPITLPAEACQPGLRAFVVAAHVKQAEQQVTEARTTFDAAKKQLADAEAASKLAAEKPAEGKPGEEKPAGGDPAAQAAKPLVADDFAAEKPAIWEIAGGMWSYAGGKLVQSQVGATQAALRLKQLPPADFEARLKYVAVDGETWKSVGIGFDTVEQNEVVAYLSSHEGGPKAQVAYKSAGNFIYPPEGAEVRAVEIGKPHELLLRVRGTLVNVAVDGQHSIAYRLPVDRRRGQLALIAFDAKAEFLAFELRELPTSLVLVDPQEAKAKPGDATAPATAPASLDQTKLAAGIAEKALVAAEAQLAGVHARAAADAAAHQQPAAENAQTLATAALRAERLAAAAKADETSSRAELDMLRAAPDKKPAAEKTLTEARAAAERAHKLADEPGQNYTPLPGAVKTAESNVETEESRRKPFPRTSSGRRSALARWITDPKNPLPARVAVNHIWSRHFGRPLVATVFDFGRKGAPPSHPELLDWLAVELVEHGWSMKHIHRLIVTSSAYRMTSSSAGAATETLTADPDNRFYWRTNPIRMESELVRDSLLHLAGELDLKLGGPPIPVGDEASRRRSLYFVHSHNEHQKFLSMFDDANVLDCYRRSDSIVPAQALALENSPLAGTMAEKISQRIAAASPNASDAQFVQAAFVTVLSVKPNEAEQAAALAGLARLTEAARSNNRPDPAAQARTNLVHALLNHNDFITVR